MRTKRHTKKGAPFSIFIAVLVVGAIFHSWVSEGMGFEVLSKKGPTKEKPALSEGPKKRPSALPKPGEIWKEPVTGMEFVRVPGGCFEMGSPSGEAGRDRDEGPVHEVCVDGFWMGKTEVTNRQYRKFKSKHNSGDYKGYSLNGDDQPAVYVIWEEAKAFAKFLAGHGDGGYYFRLPSEAEWEYACRAKTTTARFWGDDPDESCGYANAADLTAERQWSYWETNKCDDGYEVTAPVGSFKANAFGLYDMLGNVFEWSEDIYSEDAYRHHKRDNPIYRGSGSQRVIRGGCWYSWKAGMRCAGRSDHPPAGRHRDYFMGFRLVRTSKLSN